MHIVEVSFRCFGPLGPLGTFPEFEPFFSGQKFFLTKSGGGCPKPLTLAHSGGLVPRRWLWIDIFREIPRAQNPRPRRTWVVPLSRTPLLHVPPCWKMRGPRDVRPILRLACILAALLSPNALSNTKSSSAASSGVRETEILAEQQPPQGVLVCDHAGLVINKLYLKLRSSRMQDRRGLQGCRKEAPPRALTG